MDEFEERRAEFRGFNRYYRDKVLPHLISRDMERRRLVAQFKKHSILIIAAAIVTALLAYTQYHHFFAIVLPVILGVGALTLAYGKLKEMKAQTKSTLVGEICGFIGWTFTPEKFTPIPLDTFIDCGMLTTPTKAKYEDEMRGVAHGANFVLHEALLQREQGSGKDRRTVTIFRGVMIRIDFPRKFLGRTIILRDAGVFNWKTKKGLSRVGLVDPKFEKIFEAYGSDQVEARYLLDPLFMQRLVDLEALFGGKKLRAAFTDGQLLIAVEAPNQFEAGSMFKALTDRARTQKILDEIGMVFDIVDGVLKR